MHPQEAPVVELGETILSSKRSNSSRILHLTFMLMYLTICYGRASSGGAERAEETGGVGGS
jgi:hypothetical protein